MKIDSDAIKQLADLLDETGLNEIEVADGDKAIRVSKGGGTVVAAGPAPAIMAASPMTGDPGAPQPANMANHPGAITSPMVGTAYMAPEPGASDFVSKGDSVKAGDTLLIVEAMKVMNPIKAETGGTVTDILVTDGEPVEFGDVLVIIE